MTKSTTVALRLAALGLVVALGGCSQDRRDITEPGEPAPAFGAILSDPVEGSRSASAGLLGAAQASSSPAAGDVLYVSLPPETVPEGVRIVIRNLETGFTRTEPLVDGGLDPVAVPAAVGDRLELVVTLGGGATLSSVARVPARRSPRVVRTVPPRGKTDVPLNARVVVVFSEPIDPRTLTATSVQLLRGTEPVAGQVEFDADHLTAALVPDAPLAPATGYQLVVTQAIRDRDGESLEAPVTIDFTTATVQRGGGVVIENATTGGAFDITGYQVRYRVATGAESTASMQLNDSVTLINLAPGPQTVELDDVALNCSVPGGARRTVNVASGTTSKVTFKVACAAPPELASVRIVFTRATVSNSEAERVSRLYVMNGDGGGLRPLTDGPSDNWPAVSPDGSRIAFTRNWDIHVMNADGTGVRRLTFTGRVIWKPSWSADGTKIAFSDDGGIFVIGVDGTDLTRLTEPSADSSAILPYADGEPAWSPDGRQIAFWRWEMLEWSVVWTMSADGTHATRLGRRAADQGGWSPIWSPDGRIAFQRPNNRMEPAIFVIDRDGWDATELTVLLPRSNVSDWSADGRWIAFTKQREDRSDANPDIYVLAAGGSRMLRITADGRSSSPAFFRGVGF